LVTVLWISAAGALYAAMRQTPERFGSFMSYVPPIAMAVLPFKSLWMSARAGSLAVGDVAPDFALPLVQGEGVIRLSEEVRERPVVLIFGSYT
jgi:hypothetical protein